MWGLRHSAAIAALTAAAPGVAADAPFVPSGQLTAPVSLTLIDSSRLGCGQGVQCAFDTTTRGASLVARQDWAKGTLEAYSTVAHATAGAYTPDLLLEAPDRRLTEATDFFLVGLKGSAFQDRIKVMTEFAGTRRTVDEHAPHNLMRDDTASDSGTSAKVRLDARLIASPRLNWSMTAEMRFVDEDYAVGPSDVLALHAAMPGTRFSLSSRARVGQLGLSAGLDRLRTSYGRSATRKVGLDLHGASLRMVARDSDASPIAGSSLLGSDTRSTSLYLDLDTAILALDLFPELGTLPFLIPTMVNVSTRQGETQRRYADSNERFDRSSLGIDGTWETPLGETILSYLRDARTGLTPGARSYSTEMMQASHFVRRGNWRFGADAALTTGAGDGGNGEYDERAWSFGQSVAYSTPDGPEFRLALGQDRGVMRVTDSFASADNYSRITASLDLSRYLQKRFERPDLRLTLDYRKALERSETELNLFDQMVERWVDGYRREGFLMSFGMKL